MIKRAGAVQKRIYDPTARQLAWSAIKGVGAGALLAMVVVKLWF